MKVFNFLNLNHTRFGTPKPFEFEMCYMLYFLHTLAQPLVM